MALYRRCRTDRPAGSLPAGGREWPGSGRLVREVAIPGLFLPVWRRRRAASQEGYVRVSRKLTVSVALALAQILRQVAQIHVHAVAHRRMPAGLADDAAVGIDHLAAAATTAGLLDVHLELEIDVVFLAGIAVLGIAAHGHGQPVFLPALECQRAADAGHGLRTDTVGRHVARVRFAGPRGEQPAPERRCGLELARIPVQVRPLVLVAAPDGEGGDEVALGRIAADIAFGVDGDVELAQTLRFQTAQVDEEPFRMHGPAVAGSGYGAGRRIGRRVAPGHGLGGRDAGGRAAVAGGVDGLAGIDRERRGAGLGVLFLEHKFRGVGDAVAGDDFDGFRRGRGADEPQGQGGDNSFHRES
ncbi:hypothetical protein MCA0445 [Methylococcus capsulatus str. Bath]|uniref:Uncharacterized protein n=1 Tax=Methylococcus capsulatus (strain ATCC 33009 / NCIMB 11132 / Bath) TaxID=243233 RepID=Q60BM1_METCA|nr:hypothetical protein MCA0445 [Methylococcus capsulatus str. Bath]